MTTHDDGEAYTAGDDPVDDAGAALVAALFDAAAVDADRTAGLSASERTAADRFAAITVLHVLYGDDLVSI